MKKTVSIILFSFISFLIFSCSSDDNTNPDDTGLNYMPATVGNYWNYTVTSSAGSAQDSLYVSNTVVTNGFEYKDFNASPTSTGLATGIYSENLHRKDGNKHLVFGALDLGSILGNVVDFTIQLNDEVLIDETASVGSVLGTINNTFSQTVQNIPLTFEYTLTNSINNRQASLVVNGQTFNDIIETKIVLNMNITATVDVGGFPLNVTVMQAQDVLIMENSYANNIGLVQSDTEISYQLESIPGFTYPFPQSSSETATQQIRNYLVQ